MIKITYMKTPSELFLTIATAILIFSPAWLGSEAKAATLISDNFNSGTSGDVLNATTPSTTVGGAAWTARTASDSAPVFNGSGGVSVPQDTFSSTSFIHLGSSHTDYFSINPGVYTLSMDVTLPTGGTSSNVYIDLGFTTEYPSTSAVLTGNPMIRLRQDGRALVYEGVGATNNLYTSAAGAYAAGSTFNLKLVLDTSVAAWTLDAFVGATQLDLNGGAAGNTFAFTTNPTTLNGVGFGTYGNQAGVGDATVDNFQLSVVPEPSSALLLGIGATVLGLIRRRRH